MINCIHGPVTAIVLPVTKCLKLPFEVEIYWIQHILLVVVPFYLLLEDRDSREKITDYSAQSPFDWHWTLKAFGIWGLYHWIVLQGTYVT